MNVRSSLHSVSLFSRAIRGEGADWPEKCHGMGAENGLIKSNSTDVVNRKADDLSMVWLSRKRIIAIVSIILAAIIIVVTIYIITNRKEQKGDGVMNYEITMSIDQWREFVSTDLFEKALGDYDWNTGEWKPLTDRLYAFDAEVFDIERMYTLCLQGIQSIAPDLMISDIEEDLTGMTDEMEEPANPYDPPTDGVRSVQFKCNGHEYSITMVSYGDWFNVEFIPFMNQVLEKENKAKRLWILSDGLDGRV